MNARFIWGSVEQGDYIDTKIESHAPIPRERDLITVDFNRVNMLTGELSCHRVEGKVSAVHWKYQDSRMKVNIDLTLEIVIMGGCRVYTYNNDTERYDLVSPRYLAQLGVSIPGYAFPKAT